VITYVDTSSLLKLVIEEDGSDRAGVIWDSADALCDAAQRRGLHIANPLDS
jgi:uncharacterized protein